MAGAILVGGKFEGRIYPAQHFDVKVFYDEARKDWEMHKHLDLGPGFPFVLQAHSDKRDMDAIRALVISWGMGPESA